MNSFFSINELNSFGFKSLGNNVLISRKASIYSAATISIGNNVRIDDFCILSGNIAMGSFIHISAYTALYGKNGIVIGNFATISGRVLIYSQNDDYSGAFMTNPMVPEEFTNVTGGEVSIGEHVIIGAGSIVLPSLILGEGASIGAMSLVKKNVEPWTIYAGVPAKRLAYRKKDILALNFKSLL